MKKTMLTTVAAVGALAIAPAASATRDGSHASTGQGCPGTGTQVFADQNDHRSYSLVPGGDFEAGAPGWELSDGASLEAMDGDTVLSLDPGHSAVSAPVCVTKAHPVGRMFGAAEGKKAGVRVEVLYGSKRHPVGRVKLRRTWQATRRFSLAKGNFELFPETGAGTIRLEFTAVRGTTSHLDDVHIDPRRRS